MKIVLQVKEVVNREVKYLQAECGVRYWEDADVNGDEDEDGTLIPFRDGDCWRPLIDMETGVVVGWPTGTAADIHYKVCDSGFYKLLDAERNIIRSIEGYVPAMMCPEGSGHGDYVIMKIDGDGRIAKWKVNLDEFEDRP